MVSNRGAVSPLSMSAGAALSESRPPLPQDRQRNAALSRFTSRGLELQPACTERDQSVAYRGFESRLPLSMMTAAPKRCGAFSDLRGYKARIQPRRASAPVARCWGRCRLLHCRAGGRCKPQDVTVPGDETLQKRIGACRSVGGERPASYPVDSTWLREPSISRFEDRWLHSDRYHFCGSHPGRGVIRPPLQESQIGFESGDCRLDPLVRSHFRRPNWVLLLAAYPACSSHPRIHLHSRSTGNSLPGLEGLQRYSSLFKLTNSR